MRWRLYASGNNGDSARLGYQYGTEELACLRLSGMSAAVIRRYLPYMPAAVAAILAIPVVGFTYLWDDYNFLTNAVFYQLHDWFPASDDPFYRPISRGVYFTILDLPGRFGPPLGLVLRPQHLVGIVV